ncbi:MAG: hypothetical protein AAFX99_32670 [Myxococcota bacterium]
MLVTRNMQQRGVAREAAALLQEQVDAQRQANWGTLVSMVVLVASFTFFVVALGEEGGPFVLFMGVFGLLILVGWRISVHRLIREAKHKATFFDGVVQVFAHEFLPRSKVRFRVDFEPTERDINIKRTAQSIAGNTKRYYTHKWMRLTFSLPDHSRVQISRKAFKKTKKGNDLKHYRQLNLKFWPAPHVRWPSVKRNLGTLRHGLKDAIVRSFHDTPEEYNVTPRIDEGVILIKVAQYDAEILPEEVFALVEATVDFMYMHGYPTTKGRRHVESHRKHARARRR